MFCKCGALLFFPSLVSEELRCKRCEALIENVPSMSVCTSKLFHRKAEHVDIQVKGAKADVTCSQCGNNEMMYNTAQLRSADEGQTVFYTCEKCGFRETVQS